MKIYYYKDANLAYASRNRYYQLPADIIPTEETQKKVIFGDGANTSIKTSVKNICDYVVIDDEKGNVPTRWFVTSYTYLNGEQVILNLQRDVIGQFGLVNAFGKIERGYTDSILKNRKELSVNEILKRRIPLKTMLDSNGMFKTGNYTVKPKSVDTKEMWGVLYITNPNDDNNININIPEFSDVEYQSFAQGFLPENGSKVLYGSEYYVSNEFRVIARTAYSPEAGIVFKSWYSDYAVKITYIYKDNAWQKNVTITTVSTNQTTLDKYWKDNSLFSAIYVDFAITKSLWEMPSDGVAQSYTDECIKKFAEGVGDAIIYFDSTPIPIYGESFKFPNIPNTVDDFFDYTGLNVSDDGGNTVYNYTSVDNTLTEYGSYDKSIFLLYLKGRWDITIFNNEQIIATVLNGSLANSINLSSRILYKEKTYSRTQLNIQNNIKIDFNLKYQLIDEPYTIILFPLFDCTISGKDANDTYKTYTIDRSPAFQVFNTVISKLSGDNPYLVDAQIVPYAPVLASIEFELEDNEQTKKGYPFFRITSNNYTIPVKVDVGALDDIKKEYIIHKYSIQSPEQSSSFDFNFYDYKKSNTPLDIDIKIALKPFAVISSAVIRRDREENGEYALMGINYQSDLKGSQPSANGFECSLASSAFETYKRQNANYQQIFNLEKEELRINHETEKVNETTSMVVNTLTGTAMGALGGAALADVTYFGTSAKAVGAIAGAATAGTTIGVASAVQAAQNDRLREYEERLQQERFNLNIGTIKALPNQINRISSFNELITPDFYYVINCYECSQKEIEIVDEFIRRYGYGLGVYGLFDDYKETDWFLRGELISSSLITNLHNILTKELAGGIYIR